MADSSKDLPGPGKQIPPNEQTSDAAGRTRPSCSNGDTPGAAPPPTPPARDDNGDFSARGTDPFQTPSRVPGKPSPLDKPPLGSFGRYELLEELTPGGMGLVYRAWDTRLKRTVALKMIRTGQLASSEEVQRFTKEALAAARFEHDGLVRVYEVGEQAGQHYYAMEFVPGGSLASRIRKRPLPPRQAAGLLRQVAEAVQYAHGREVIHRDLKPDNILLDEGGRPKVADFGLARMIREDSNLTVAGQIMGTPAYMSPEQAGGKSLEAGPAADVYCLGATFYCLLTGRPPFQAASTLETLRQVVQEEPVSPRARNRTVDRDLETICLKCLRKEPGQRYASAAALAEDLGLWLAGKPIKARPVSRAEHLWRWCRRNPLTAGLAAGVAVSLLLGTAVSTAFALRASAREQDARRARAESDGRLYVAEIQLAHRAWKEGQIDQVRQKLGRLDPERRRFESDYLERLCHLDLRTLQGHEGPVQCLAFSPDGGLLVTGGVDHKVKLWETATGRELRTLGEHGEKVWSVAFSPGDGRWLASAGGDKTVLLWDVATGRLLKQLTGAGGSVPSIAFHPEGKSLAAACGDGLIRVFGLASGETTLKLKHEQSGVQGVAYSPDGRRLATAGNDGSVKVWDAATGEQLHLLKGHTDVVHGVAFSPDGRTLASVSRDEMLILWDLANGKLTRTVHAHADLCRGVAFSPDGLRLATAGDDHLVKIWDVDTGREVLTLRGHAGAVQGVAFGPPHGWRLASAGADGTVKVWDATAGLESETLRVQGDMLRKVVFSPDRQRFAASGSTVIKVWDAVTGRETLSLSGHTGSVQGLAFSPDGGRLVTVSTSHDAKGRPVAGELKVWDAATGAELRSLGGDAGHALAVAFSPDGRVATAGRDHVVRVWDVTAGEEVLTLRGPAGPVRDVTFGPGGGRVAGTCADGSVWVWDARTGREVVTLGEDGKLINRLAFSPDGSLLAAAGGDNLVRVWDLSSRQVVYTLRGHLHGVDSVAFSPDGRRLATASSFDSVKLWDLLTQQELLTWDRRADHSFDVAFSPDGRRLAVAGGRPGIVTASKPILGDVQVWDARPLTPDLLARREASSLVRFLLANPSECAERLQNLQADRTISEAVRRRALAEHPE